MYKKQKTTSKWFYFVAVGTNCIIIALTFSAYLTAKDQLAEQFNKQQLILAREAAAGIENYTGAIENNLFYLAQKLSRYPSKYKESQAYNWQLLQDKLLYLIHLDAKGRVVDFHPHDLDIEISSDYSKKYYRLLLNSQELLSSPYISNVYKGDTGINTIAIVMPIQKDAKFLGTLIAAVDLNKMLELFLSSIKSGESGYAWLLDDGGNLLYHPHHTEMVGNNIFTASDACNNCHLDFDLERQVISSARPGSLITVAPNSKNKRLMAYYPIKIGQRFWLVAVEAPYAEVTSLLGKKFRNTMLLAALAIVIIFFIALYVLELNRKRLAIEIEAKDLKDLLGAIFENAPMEIAVIDNQQRFVYVNKFWEWINGVSRDNAVGKTPGGCLPDLAAAPAFCKIIEKTLQKGLAQDNVAISYFVREGPYKGRHVHKIFWTIPLFKEEKKVVRCAVIGYNITEVKRLERQLVQSEKLAASGKLAASVAHEINNPIYGIQGCLDYLRSNVELSEQDKKFVELSYRETKRISRLVRKMHDFYRPRDERMQLTDVNELLKDVLLLQRHSLKEHAIKLVTSYKAALPKIMASDDQLKQVFINMISNAKDAMPNKGVLTITTNYNKKHVMVSFADTGCGIPSENKEKIFEAFFTTKQEVTGVGLGLSVSYGIVQRHKGKIELEDVLPHGVKFNIILPILTQKNK